MNEFIFNYYRIAVGYRMLLGMQDFDFAQICPKNFQGPASGRIPCIPSSYVTELPYKQSAC